MSEKNITLPSPKYQDWETVKAKTEKINKSLTHFSTKIITNLSELIHAGAKLV